MVAESDRVESLSIEACYLNEELRRAGLLDLGQRAGELAEDEDCRVMFLCETPFCNGNEGFGGLYGDGVLLDWGLWSHDACVASVCLCFGDAGHPSQVWAG